jgi:hypothetical protein
MSKAERSFLFGLREGLQWKSFFWIRPNAVQANSKAQRQKIVTESPTALRKSSKQTKTPSAGTLKKS